MNTETIIKTIKDSGFSNDPELSNTLRIINDGHLSNDATFFVNYTYKSTLKRIKTLQNDSINLPTNLFSRYECVLIEDFMLNNEWSTSDINDADAYKGKYWIYDNTPNEMRVCFFKQDGDLFAELGDDLIQL